MREVEQLKGRTKKKNNKKRKKEHRYGEVCRISWSRGCWHFCRSRMWSGCVVCARSGVRTRDPPASRSCTPCSPAPPPGSSSRSRGSSYARGSADSCPTTSIPAPGSCWASLASLIQTSKCWLPPEACCVTDFAGGSSLPRICTCATPWRRSGSIYLRILSRWSITSEWRTTRLHRLTRSSLWTPPHRLLSEEEPSLLQSEEATRYAMCASTTLAPRNGRQESSRNPPCTSVNHRWCFATAGFFWWIEWGRFVSFSPTTSSDVFGRSFKLFLLATSSIHLWWNVEEVVSSW